MNTMETAPPSVEGQDSRHMIESTDEPTGQVSAPPELVPEVSIHLPRKKGRRMVAGLVIAVSLWVFGYWKFHDLKWLFDELLPYSQSIGGAAVAAMVLRYKDVKSYKHPMAALAVLCTIFVFSGLTAVNTYKERHEKARDQKSNADSIAALVRKIDQTKEQVGNNTEKTAESLKTISGDLKDFKETVRPDELRGEMAVVKSELEKTQAALTPPPKASLVFTFGGFKNPKPGETFTPVREITLPATADGVVKVPISIVNHTDTDALQGHLNVFICDDCKFAKEPERMMRLKGMPDQARNLEFSQLLASESFEDIQLELIVPPRVRSFKIAVQHRCRTCVLQKEAVTGTVLVNWP